MSELRIIVFFNKPVNHIYDASRERIRTGVDKIQAIKSVRSITNGGLRDCKECVEATRTIDVFIDAETYTGGDFTTRLDYVRRAGGTVVFDGNHWEDYIDELKEMLFRAKMSGHDAVVYEFEKIIKEYNYFKEFKT